jgi:hypothetical protein
MMLRQPTRHGVEDEDAFEAATVLTDGEDFRKKKVRGPKKKAAFVRDRFGRRFHASCDRTPRGADMSLSKKEGR